jgi:r-opsin
MEIFGSISTQINLFQGIAGDPLTIKGACLKIAFIWIFSLGWTLAPFIGWGR